MASYSWLTFVQARQQLATRLADTGNAKWTDVENGIYIIEALRWWNALTLTWKQDFAFTPSAPWNFLGLNYLSPRARTVTDVNLYTTMEYHLYEPPTGGVWTGTAQFSITDLENAVQSRQDEMILLSNSNQAFDFIEATPTIVRQPFPDTTLEPQRLRFLGINPANGDPLPPVTLYRDDKLAVGYFNPLSYQAPAGTPQVWMVAAEPPLSFDVDVPPAVEGLYEALILHSGQPLTPPVGTLLGIPDDFTPILKWGAMADLLGRESEATDRKRAEYCQKRYSDGLKLLQNTPWIFLARVNGLVTNFPDIWTMDRYYPNWDSTAGFSAIVIGGIDTVWAPVGQGVLLNVLGNAPIPVNDTDFVQTSRSSWDAILNYAQLLATFKIGGSEFEEAQGLEAEFVKAAMAENDRLENMGLFSDLLIDQSTQENRQQERYTSTG